MGWLGLAVGLGLAGGGEKGKDHFLGNKERQSDLALKQIPDSFATARDLKIEDTKQEAEAAFI